MIRVLAAAILLLMPLQAMAADCVPVSKYIRILIGHGYTVIAISDTAPKRIEIWSDGVGLRIVTVDDTRACIASDKGDWIVPKHRSAGYEG